ncbi:hypothetical protein Avbf_05113 [Armadillidium vulgare]|nr:hypothetical protein Avbf_05113 [Armadillidium vulgare]
MLCNLWGEEYDLIASDSPLRKPSFSSSFPGESYFLSGVEASRPTCHSAERETVESYTNYGSKDISVSVIKKHKGITRQCSFRSRKPSRGTFLEVLPEAKTSSLVKNYDWHPGPNSFRCRTPSKCSPADERDSFIEEDSLTQEVTHNCIDDVSETFRSKKSSVIKDLDEDQQVKVSTRKISICYGNGKRKRSSCIIIPSTVQETSEEGSIYRLKKLSVILPTSDNMNETHLSKEDQEDIEIKNSLKMERTKTKKSVKRRKKTLSLPRNIRTNFFHERKPKTNKVSEMLKIKSNRFDMSDLVPINLEKTFRTELNLPFEGERSNLMPHDELDNGKILHSKAAIVVTDKTIPKTISATQMLHDPNAENGFSEDSFIVSKKLNSQFFSLHDDYVIHPSTGSRMTVGQAVAAGVLNLALESFQDPASNSTMSFQEAVSRGFLSPELAELFSNPCGVIDPDTGRELTLSEAVKLGLYDPERGSFIDPSSGKLVTPHDAAKIGLILKEKVSLANRLSISPKSLSLYDAVKTGLVDVNTGFVSSNELNKFIPLKEALELGIISTSDYSSNSQILGLADTISQGLINPCTSQLIDKHSDSLYSIEEAITKNIISGNVCEIFTEAGNKVTVNDALKLGILNSRKGSFYDVANNQYLSLVEAYEKQLICRPYSLKDCCDQNLLNENGTIRNPVTNKNRTLLEAVGEGILDLNIKSIKNTRLKCFHNLAEAFMHSVILVEGKYCDTITGEVMSLVQAVHKGFITSVSTKSIFDIEAIKNPETGHYITFNEAVAENIISLENGKYQTSKGEKLTLEEAVARQFIQPQIYTALMMKVGMFDKQENEMTVFDAVINNNLDPKRAFIADPFSSNFIPLSEAVTRALISPLGAATVAGLMNITLSTSTITKTIRRPGTAMDDQTTVVKNVIVFEEELETKPTSLNKEELPQKRMHSPLNEESRSKIIKSDYTDILEISDKESLLKRPESIFDEDNAYDIENNKGSPDIRDESSICHIPSSMKSSGIDAEASFKTDEDQTPVSPDTKSLPKKTSSEISSMVHSTDSAMDTDMTLSGVSSSGIVEPLSISTKVYEIPEDGWYLKEAINGNLFDAVAGLFVVPGTDRLVGFQECIKLGIINPNSADVIDFNSGKITSITKALNKNLLDPFGKYPLFENSEERMTMREAVEKGYIKMKDRSCKLEDEPKPRKDSAKSLYVTSIEGHPEQLQVQVAGEEEDQVFYVPTCQNVQSHSEILNKNIRSQRH